MQERFSSLFEKYQSSRLMLKYEQYARWTVPGVFPKESTSAKNDNKQIESDFQSMGALLLNNMAAKMASLLFPMNINFFKVAPTEEVKKLIGTMTSNADSTALQELVKLENGACARNVQNGGYMQLIQWLMYLFVTGNALTVRKKQRWVVYSPRHFGWLADDDGTVLDIVLKEEKYYGSLPADLKMALQGTGRAYQPQDKVKFFTRVNMFQNPVTISLEVDDVPYGEPELVDRRICPFIPTMLKHIPGDNYGRGLVEDYAGDFAKLSAVSEAMTYYILESCKVINLVKPGAAVNVKDLQNAIHGQFVLGDPTSISKLEAGEWAKIQQISAELDLVFNRLSKAFLYDGNVRDAERVTAEEIRMLAQESEKLSGGLYSAISNGMHIPMAHILCYEENREFLNALIQDEIELNVSTGLATLGRNAELQGLYSAVQELALIIPAMQQVSERFDTERTIDNVLAARGVNKDEYLLSKEALEQKQQDIAQQQQDMQGMVDMSQGIGEM